MFANISQFSEQTAEIIESIMYEAYYTKETLLPQVTAMLGRCLPLCEIKYFITTLNQISSQPKSTENTTFLDKIFKDKQNQPESKAKKNSIVNSTRKPKQLSLNENMQFFILAQNTTYQ